MMKPYKVLWSRWLIVMALEQWENNFAYRLLTGEFMLMALRSNETRIYFVLGEIRMVRRQCEARKSRASLLIKSAKNAENASCSQSSHWYMQRWKCSSLKHAKWSTYRDAIDEFHQILRLEAEAAALLIIMKWVLPPMNTAERSHIGRITGEWSVTTMTVAFVLSMIKTIICP